MATEKKRTIPTHQDTDKPGTNHEVPDVGINEEVSEHELFAGDENFYKFLADSSHATQVQSPHTGIGASQPFLTSISRKRLSKLQISFIIGIIVIGSMLVYSMYMSYYPGQQEYTFRPSLTAQRAPTVIQTLEQPVERTVQVDSKTRQQISKTELLLSPTQPLSLQVAESFYLQKDYEKAYAIYYQLRENIPISIETAVTEEELLRDFLELKMAFCTKKISDFDKTSQAFRTVSQSRSPAIRTVANYELVFFELQKEQYLKARTRAYQTLALLDAVDFDKDWVLLLKRNCHFLIAQCLTRNVFSLCDADKELPKDLWANPVWIDPFGNLGEMELRGLLKSGTELLNKGLLEPQIQKLMDETELARWSVICYRAPLEELMVRFATNASLDIHWVFGDSESSSEDTLVSVMATRKRPVSLYLPAATTQQFVNTAAGSVSLLAMLDNKPNIPTINIFNPSNYATLSEHISLLSQQAISLWQRFILTFGGDQRIAHAHFAMGLLQAITGRTTDAIAEYKLTANRFAQTSPAPFALLHSGKLKASVQDYSGAMQDLIQLVEQYPDSEISSQALLYLADATSNAGLKAEAARLYRKVYNLDLSHQSQTAACLGAGKSFYQIKDYEAVAKWLIRYINLANNQPSADLYSAYFLLGKANLALGKPQQACKAFQCALAGELATEDYIEALSALVKAQIQQDNLVEALESLENIRSWQLPQDEFTKILLLKANVLRAMGLVDKAIAILGDRAQYLPETELKTRISFELAKCYVVNGDLALARKKLVDILALVEPGPLADEVALELADVCLKLGQDSQTISICSQLLDSSPATEIKQKALVLLATAYNSEKNYDKAALSLLGQWETVKAPNENRISDSQATEEQPLIKAQ
jgi:tetratricopeptide (TPR) repeat protein